MIAVEHIWLAARPVDMRAGFDTLLARVVTVFGAAHPHTAYCFANRRSTRLKVLVHDGFGVWVAARRLNQGRFVWADPDSERLALAPEQLAALVLGLPWQRLGATAVIDTL